MLPVPPTPLIGRERELLAIGQQLAQARLVTLTGPGGSGPHRLALEVAFGADDLFADGVVFVDLSPFSEPALVLPAIADALRIRDPDGQSLLETLQAHLWHKRLFLLLDHFEHVLAAAAEIASLLRTSPDLQVLIRNRAPLRVRVEQKFPVHPLALPDLRQLPSLEQVVDIAAMQLLVARVQAVSLDFSLTRHNAAALAAICERLEGLPLALKLSAARMKVLSPKVLLARLARVLPVLVGGARDLPERQQTMRGTIEWSYRLLAGSEQALFRQLAVFAGRWTLKADAGVGAGEGEATEDMLGLLTSRVDSSLVVAGPHTPRVDQRFRLPEPIREYALERLQERREDVAARRFARLPSLHAGGIETRPGAGDNASRADDGPCAR